MIRMEGEEGSGASSEQTPLRSIEHDKSSFVRFVNKTNRDVKIYWVDYQGRAVSYGQMAPDYYVDINTFVTHPWIFVDRDTGDRFTVEQRDVFFPRETITADGRHYRHRAFITLPMYTLRELTLRIIRNHLRYSHEALQLELPQNLEAELIKMLPAQQPDQSGSANNQQQI
ncbi:von Hippel-Lindau disease tumor suppressor [Prorops nasuta]|uniref:von Hippel-Lindau disease tumor suppressor n=1 Tax=Prorops nasuta TaxID=863751 RepID=UPI0034CDAF00